MRFPFVGYGCWVYFFAVGEIALCRALSFHCQAKTVFAGGYTNLHQNCAGGWRMHVTGWISILKATA
jgi:hypothetical protein